MVDRTFPCYPIIDLRVGEALVASRLRIREPHCLTVSGTRLPRITILGPPPLLCFASKSSEDRVHIHDKCLTPSWSWNLLILSTLVRINNPANYNRQPVRTRAPRVLLTFNSTSVVLNLLHLTTLHNANTRCHQTRRTVAPSCIRIHSQIVDGAEEVTLDSRKLQNP